MNINMIFHLYLYTKEMKKEAYFEINTNFEVLFHFAAHASKSPMIGL